MKPDRIRREFHRLSDIPVPEDLLERALQRDPTPPRSPGSRALVAFVALAVFAGAGAFAWSAFRPRSSHPQPPADEGEIPTVVRMDCGEPPRLVTPEVQVQPGGVLIHVEDVGNAVGVEGSLLDDPESGAWAFDFGESQAAGGFDIALGIAPGAYVVVGESFLLGSRRIGVPSGSRERPGNDANRWSCTRTKTPCLRTSP